ncbi:unnamed protein product [Closterium sp. Yama58-4]|nr:unnamed protein product [Closterium sp. Yama58-4]
MAAVAAPTRAGGLAILSFKDGEIEDVQGHSSGRLLHARLRWGTRLLRVLAVYFLAQPPPRRSFLGTAFKDVTESQPRGEDLVVAGDFNMIADPIVDKSNRQGVTGDNCRMMQMLADFHAKDAFRELNPDERQFTFYCKSAKVSSRIDMVLVSQSMLHLVARVKHKKIPKGITDHKFAVKLRLGWRGPRESGPGLWRFPTRLLKRPGVAKAIAEVVQRHREGGSRDFDRLSRSLAAQLRKYDKEERRRVKHTRSTLEEQVELLQHKAMADPYDDEVQALLSNREAMLQRYWDGRRNLLQIRTGLKVHLEGEAPTSFPTALVKSRKAKMGIKELVRNGISHTKVRKILEAATCHFREALDEAPAGTTEPRLEWSLRKTLDEVSAESLTRDWLEQEVKHVLKELANDKSPGRDGLLKELFQRHWELLREPVMKMVGEFAATGKLPEMANEAVTILLYKKGAETDIRNYRPITLLS